jgi:hypothetical protein
MYVAARGFARVANAHRANNLSDREGGGLKQPRIVIGAVALVGVLALLLIIRASSPSDGTEDSAGSSSWWGGKKSDGVGQSTSVSALSESERKARDLEQQVAASMRLKRAQGGAGGAAPVPRYPSDPVGIGRAMLGVKPALRECYENFGRRNEGLPKDVNVRVTIGLDPNDPTAGMVTKAETKESAFQHPSVDECVKSAVGDLRFEAPTHPVQANLPLVVAQRR